MTMRPLSAKARQALAHPSPSIEAYEGSVRSGKTVCTLVDWARYIRSGPAGQLAMSGRTERTVINNLILPMQDMFGPSRVKINYGTGVVNVFGRAVHVYGANNEQSRTKIQGATLAGAYVDEASTVPESFFNMLYTRLSVPGAKLWLTANPEGPNHWLKKKWLDRARLWVDGTGNVILRPDADSLELHRYTFLLDDNDALDPAYVERTKRSYTGMFHRRYINAEWVAAEGAIYDMFDPALHVVPWEDMPPMARYVGVGLDYGTTNATSAVLLGQDRTGGYWAVDEFRYDPTLTAQRLTDSQLATRFREWLLKPHTPHAAEPLIPAIAVDPAAASFKVELSNMFGSLIRNADNEVLAGIRVIASDLAQGRMRVTTRCEGITNEAPGYSWDPKATEKGEDKPLKTNDHSMDAWRYARALDPHDLTLTGPAVAGIG